MFFSLRELAALSELNCQQCCDHFAKMHVSPRVTYSPQTYALNSSGASDALALPGDGGYWLSR